MTENSHTETSPSDNQAWLDAGGDLLLAVVDAEHELDRVRAAFRDHARDPGAVIGRAVRSARLRRSALVLVRLLPQDVRRALLPDLLAAASVSHADMQLAQDVVLTLPRDWLAANVEAAAEPLLHGDEPWEEHRRLLELFEEIDPNLARRFAERALRHEHPDVREAGQDTLDRLAKRPSERG